ncbi:MAG: mechanosensitive ion channel domain-containing protein, partial [Steroidobacteraceae bacterium]
LLLSRFVGDMVFAAAKGLATAQRTALARLVQGATLAAAILVGADQLGIRVTWIAVLTLIIVACLLGGVALAVSLGARGFVANLIGAHYLRQSFQVGETIRVAGHEGRILAVTASTVVLETSDGRVSIPAKVFHDETIVLVKTPHE